MKTPSAAPAPNRARDAQRLRISAYLPCELRERLSKYCAAGATSESAVVAAALQEYLEHSSDGELVMRRLDRLDQAVAQVLRAIDLQSEAFAVFMKIWFAHTPSIAPDGRRAALALSEGRYRQYIEHVGARVAAGLRFAQELLRGRPPGEGQKPAAGTSASAPADVREAGPHADDGHGSA